MDRRSFLLMAVSFLGLAGSDADARRRGSKPYGYRRRSYYGAASSARAYGGGGRSLYANCSEARAAGAAPIREGDRGYSRRLDRDGDGIACE